MDGITWLLTPVVAALLIAAGIGAARLGVGWRSHGPDARAEIEDADRIALEDERHRLMVMLKDLELEHALGKLSEDDYDGLKRFYEREAVRVIAQLDEIS